MEEQERRVADLRALDLFSGVGDQRLSQLTLLSRWREYGRRQPIDLRRDEDRAWIVVWGGLLLVCVSPAGRTQGVNRFQRGQFFRSTVPWLPEEDYILPRTMAEGATVCSAPYPVFLETVASSPTAVAEALSVTDAVIQQLQSLSASLTLHDAPFRVRRTLLDASVENPWHEAHYTLEEIAWRAGTTPARASEVIADLARRGHIRRLGRARLVVLHPDDDS
ncbi:MAG: hypothetical protein DLM70_16505 [Chloroflexi bacterium]|nr:MAG: hypothetical protein DLM70_16505 [Chloroflexota bacterium]